MHGHFRQCRACPFSSNGNQGNPHFSRDEKKQEDLRTRLGNPRVKFFNGDVRHYDSVLPAMQGVDYVFHAAALKQVSSCEFFPLETVRTNNLGAENVMNAAMACGVKNLIVLS